MVGIEDAQVTPALQPSRDVPAPASHPRHASRTRPAPCPHSCPNSAPSASSSLHHVPPPLHHVHAPASRPCRASPCAAVTTVHQHTCVWQSEFLVSCSIYTELAGAWTVQGREDSLLGQCLRLRHEVRSATELGESERETERERSDTAGQYVIRHVAMRAGLKVFIGLLKL